MKSSDDLFPDDPMKISAAARLMGCSPATVWRWILKGYIRGWRKGGTWRISRAELLSNWDTRKTGQDHPEALALQSLKATAPRI
jgi:excisionase family DNA binding protein